MGRVCRMAAPSRSGGRGWGPPGRGLSQWLRGLRVAQSRGLALEKGRRGGSTTYLGRKIKCLEPWDLERKEEGRESWIRTGNDGPIHLRWELRKSRNEESRFESAEFEEHAGRPLQ